LTSDEASDESILWHDTRDRSYVADGGVAVEPVAKGGPEERDAYPLKDYKKVIVRTVAVDVDVSDR
jgi:hypothetical protein